MQGNKLIDELSKTAGNWHTETISDEEYFNLTHKDFSQFVDVCVNNELEVDFYSKFIGLNVVKHLFYLSNLECVFDSNDNVIELSKHKQGDLITETVSFDRNELFFEDTRIVKDGQVIKDFTYNTQQLILKLLSIKERFECMEF